ncbi:pentapeptide repeat-containing protein [Aliarcobacter butzleri]|uniref:Pentapeptide repeat-containing protein n=1 Tax=Aliarcobacter butzleri TaxID=28197 RepID=A0AAW7QC10_9BACT|nr:pentapeptide repeat-containing protein [Aliarcobacter butzleri]MDN5107398.1 pentapeptide repeat-containing protein [Aliarcobacter butzleri]MDN5123939.1 pentapeptide repeat-containing protein [Aliarcobacter butzleri]
MDDCQNCTPTKKCILHIEKSDYRTDFGKRGFLDNFYEELFSYVINYEKIKNCIKIKIDIDYSEETNIKSEKFFEILNDEEKLRKVIINYFEMQNDEQLDKYFSSLIINKIENSDSSIDGSSLQYYLDEFFKEETIIFEQIFFPTYDARDKFNYMKIIRKLKKIHFDACKFTTKFFDLTDIEVFFQDCEFLDNFSVSNSAILENELDVVYQNCTFHRDVSISKANDKNYKINHTLFSDCAFRKKLQIENIEFEKGVFNNTKYDDDIEDKEYLKIDKLELKNCIINDTFILEKYAINKLDLSESTFKSKVKIQRCDIDEATFYNTKFKDLADFYQSKFKKVDFERTDFEKISVFSESEFNCDVDFKYTKFLGKSIFRDTVITGKLDLRNSIFDNEANFLDITSKKREKKEGQFIGEPIDIKVANRETARIIKNFYDNSNNIIEANRFYKLEMEKREKELNLKNNFFEWIIFKFHKISSNHSQDWVLVLLWILNISYLYYFVKKNTYYYLDEFLGFILLLGVCILIYLLMNFRNYFGKIILIFSFLLFMSYFSIDINEITNLINPFSIMTKGETLFLGLMIYKVIIAYLIYQLIISIRQNTRRK